MQHKMQCSMPNNDAIDNNNQGNGCKPLENVSSYGMGRKSYKDQREVEQIIVKSSGSLTIKSPKEYGGGRAVLCWINTFSTIDASMVVFYEGHSEERHTKERIVNQLYLECTK